MSTPIKIQTTKAGKKPTGSEFILDRCDFKFGEQIDVEAISIDDDKLTSWPMLYILANQDKAYVGQTTSIKTRMTQHSANEERKDFDTCNVIFNEQFNTSVITDYEHRLICSMQADGKYQLTNKNDGMASSNYYSKQEYDAMFEDLWANMQSWNLAQHSLDEIEESEVFKYSPFKSLTPDQRVALDKIMEEIHKGLVNSKPIVIQGMPGTGKTILAIYLLKSLKDNPNFKDKNIKLIEPVVSLKTTLRKAIKNISGLKASDVISPIDTIKEKSNQDDKPIDIAIVDEAHKLKQRQNLPNYGSFDDACRTLDIDPLESTQLDWILKQSKLSLLFYDPLQAIGPSCIDPNKLGSILGSSLNNPINLSTQIRCLGGTRYLNYIKNVINGHQKQKEQFKKYEICLHDSFADFYKSYEEKLNSNNLTRMIAGYAWKWKSKKDKSAIDITLDGIELQWNSTLDDWVGKGFKNEKIAHEVGCIHSIQGYDLSYAYVIIGDDIKYDPQTNSLKANRDSYYDRYGKYCTTDEELDAFIKNIYYVLLTRGINGVHIYALNSDVNNYLRKFFKTL